MLLDHGHLHVHPGQLIFGPGSLSQLASHLYGGQRHLIVTDPGLIPGGQVAKLTQVLDQAGIPHAVFAGVVPEPPLECVEQGYQAAREAGCGAVIGLGGGSAMDVAKVVALRLVDQRPLSLFAEGLEVDFPVAPLYAVPTTAGTGSEATRGAVLTDKARQEKIAVRGPHLVPRVAVLDADLLATLPARLAAETGADALTHAIEALVSQGANPLTDALACAAIQMVGDNLRLHAARPDNREAAQAMLLASYLAGQAFTNAGLGLVHSLAEPAGVHWHLGHGLACALYLPVVMDFNCVASPAKFARVAQLLGEDTTGLPAHKAARLAVRAVRDLWSDCGLPQSLAEVGVDCKLEPRMIDEVMPMSCTASNPRHSRAQDVESLFLAPLGPGLL